MNARECKPDVLVIGAPKAGTTALHTALARHPQVYACPVKEPKYFLCGGKPPPAFNGRGDAHSQQEWIWRPEDYRRLFRAARPDQLRLESTPFYLYDGDARRRIAEELPEAKLIAVVRDPIDRAYSNWMHLWVDGLEQAADFVAACQEEDARVRAGWAPFWHYRRLGRYGEQLNDLKRRVDPDRLLVLRYRELVSEPARALAKVTTFLRIDASVVTAIPADNSRGYVAPGPKAQATGALISVGAGLGRFAPPQVWRQVSRPVLAVRRAGEHRHRPELNPDQRRQLLEDHLEDIALLEDLLGEDFGDWRATVGRGSYRQRVAASVRS